MKEFIVKLMAIRAEFHGASVDASDAESVGEFCALAQTIEVHAKNKLTNAISDRVKSANMRLASALEFAEEKAQEFKHGCELGAATCPCLIAHDRNSVN